MIAPERLELLQRVWVMQFDRVGISPPEAYPLFDGLTVRYQESHRHYHNLEHIGEVLKVIGKLGDLARDPSALFLAAWYHDSIYDPRAKDNEERSAGLALTQLEPLRVPADTLARVAGLIRATVHPDMAVADADTAIFLDADLAILGAEEKRYMRYAEAIRKEYSWVDDAGYRAGRAQVLRNFLNRQRLFRTERMFAVGEEPARANMQRELKLLEQ